MNAIVLAAGEGKRFGSPLKVLSLVNGVPLLEYSLRNAISLGSEKIFLVVNRDVQKRIRYNHRNIRIVIQENPSGTMDAIKLVTEKEDVFPFLLMLGDEILVEPRLNEMIRFFNNSNLDGVVGFLFEDNQEEIKKTYSIRHEGYIVTSLIEKPKVVENNIKGTGNCIITSKLWSKMVESGENNFVEAIDYAVKNGCKVGMFEVCRKYFNVNTLQDLYNARKYLEEKE